MHKPMSLEGQACHSAQASARDTRLLVGKFTKCFSSGVVLQTTQVGAALV